MTALHTITHRGVPVGTVALPPEGERVTVAVTPLAGYEAIRPLARMASRALAAVALGTRGAPTQYPGTTDTTLARAAELGRALELRDAHGALVPTDFIELTDWPGEAPEVAAVIGLRLSHAPRPSSIRPPPTPQ